MARFFRCRLAARAKSQDSPKTEVEKKTKRKSLHSTSQISRLVQVLEEQLQRRVDKACSELKTKLLTAMHQVESANNLLLFFQTGTLLPPFHGWPISPDFAEYLVRLLTERSYDCVLEFGSGSSTLLLAKARTLLHQSTTLHAVFEHQADYAQKTETLLTSAGLPLPLMFTVPLVPWSEGDREYSYYQCAEALATCAERLANRPTMNLLAVVDGPPGATCPLARYPVLAHIFAAFPNLSSLDLLLDDSDRSDEEECGRLWQEQATSLGWSVCAQKLPFEKGAFFLRITKAQAEQ